MPPLDYRDCRSSLYSKFPGNFKRWGLLFYCKMMFSRGGPPFQADEYQRWASFYIGSRWFQEVGHPFCIRSWCLQMVVHLFMLEADNFLRWAPFYIGRWWFKEMGHSFTLEADVFKRGGGAPFQADFQKKECYSHFAPGGPHLSPKFLPPGRFSS